MTEKRFYVAESNLIDGYCVFDREKKYAFHPRQRKADCLNDAHTLNELAEENQDNKAMIEFLDTENTQITNEIKTRTQIQHQLEKENEQLKQQLKTKYIVNKQYEELQRLKKENKAVKEETQQLKWLIIHMGYTIKNENGTITLELKR